MGATPQLASDRRGHSAESPGGAGGKPAPVEHLGVRDRLLRQTPLSQMRSAVERLAQGHTGTKEPEPEVAGSPFHPCASQGKSMRNSPTPTPIPTPTEFFSCSMYLLCDLGQVTSHLWASVVSICKMEIVGSNWVIAGIQRDNSCKRPEEEQLTRKCLVNVGHF